MPVSRWTVPALLALFTVSCREETGPEITPPTARDRLADDLAAALCEGAAPCCAELGYGEPTADCRSSVRNAVMATIIHAEDQLRVLVPGEHEACIAAFQAAIAAAPTCDDLPAPLDMDKHCPTVFTPAPEGAGQPGDPCTGLFECASPPSAGTRACVNLPTGAVCVWYLDRAEGEDCTSSNAAVAICSDGLACVPAEAGPPACGAPPAAGAPCVLGDRTCVEGYVCEAGQSGDLTCQPHIQAGESCFDRPNACERGLYCNAAFNCSPLPDPCASGDCPALILQNVCR